MDLIMRKQLLILIALILFSGAALAGSASGKITGIFPYTTNTGKQLFFMKVEGTISAPECSTTGRFVISEDDPSFKTVVSAALAAYHAKTKIKVNGKGTCNNWVNSEDITYVCFGDIPC